MSWTAVDFSLVRYSPVEGTHFFYDIRHPSSVQFLLSGRWEPWDVGWVKFKAQDPEIRRMAEDAESRLAQDSQSGYRQWPDCPPPGPPGLPSVVPEGLQPLPSAVSHAQQGSVLPSVVPSPSSKYAHSAHHPTSVSPATLVSPIVPAVKGSYTSPYSHRPPPTSVQPPRSSTALAYGAPIPPSAANSNGHHEQGNAPQQPPPGPRLQPAGQPNVILSRNRETKILLSLDGDGIRGLSTLLVVESLVNAVCVKIGQRLDPHQIFDLTGGSSLGGAIAILLCRLRMHATRARETYMRVSKQVYLNKRDYFTSLEPRGATPQIDGKALEDTIKDIVQQELGNDHEPLLDRREDSGDVFVVSTHVDIGTNRAALMRSYQTRRITGPEIDANMTICQAMKATCVAPRYIYPQPGVNQRPIIEPGLVDYGTAKNNPIRDILYECRKLFRYANDMMIIVSIGTGDGLDRNKEIPEMANNVEDRSAEARVWGQKFEADNQALMDRGWMNYFRFNVPGLENVPLEEWRHEDLIKEKTSAYLAQPEVSQRFYICVDAITALLLGQGR